MTRLHVPVSLRWADLDPYGHVNNVAWATLLEEVRIEAFWRRPGASVLDEPALDGPLLDEPLLDEPLLDEPLLDEPASGESVRGALTRAEDWPTAVIDAGPGAATSTLIARQEIEYLLPLNYRRDPVVVELWIGKLGGASVDLCYEVHDEGALYVRAETTMVLADAATGAPRRMTADERAAWLPYVEAPVELRRRRG